MKIYHEKFKDSNFKSVLSFVRNQNIDSIPNSVLRAHCKYRTLKTSHKLTKNCENFVALHSGMSELSSGALFYVVDSIATIADLWGSVNNTAGKLRDSGLYGANQDEIYNETEAVDKLWCVYKQVNAYSLDKLFKRHEYDRGNWASMTEYIESLLTQIEKKLGNTESRLQKMKNPQDTPFSHSTKKIFIILLENIELRKVLCECNRQLLANSLSDTETKS